MNCIDCENVFNCKLANEEIRKCDDFINAHRKVVHIDLEKEVKEMLEDE